MSSQCLTILQPKFDKEVSNACNVIGGLVAAVLAIAFGIIMLIKPQIVACLIGIYLIIIGIMFLVQTYLS